MNTVIDIGDGETSLGIVYASGGIKMVKASLERQYEPLSMWFLLGCSRSNFKTILVVYVQSAYGLDKIHESRYAVSEAFGLQAIKHITKQVVDYQKKILDDDDNLNDAFWHDCTAHCSGFEAMNISEEAKAEADKADEAADGAEAAEAAEANDNFDDMPGLVSYESH